MIARKTCRLVLQVPRTLALLSPPELESHVRAHWAEWQNRWKQVEPDRSSDELLKVDAGQPIFLIERSGKYYLLTEGTRIVFDTAA